MTATYRSDETGEPDTPSADGSDESELSADAVFAALRHPYRRYVLYQLSDRSEGASLANLAEWIADWEADVTIDSDRAAEQERVVATLYHKHLPKLDNLGLVDYDREDDCITRCEGTTGVEPYLRFAADYELVPN